MRRTTQLLEDIASKLEIIHITLKDFVDTFKTKKNQSSETLLNIKNKLNVIAECSETVANEPEKDPEIEVVERPKEVTALSVKQSIFRIWKKSLNERKMVYWTYFRFGSTAVTYEKWLGKVNPVLPRKFRPIAIPGETEEDKEIRKEMALKTLESEVKIL